MKEKRKLSPGDRIKFEGWACIWDGGELRGEYYAPTRAVVDCGILDDSSAIRIKIGERQALISRRQVVSVLKPKKAPAAPERVERWIHKNVARESVQSTYLKITAPNRCDFLRLVEVREGERILSRADLERAFDKIGLEKRSDHANIRGELAEALGFSEEREP